MLPICRLHVHSARVYNGGVISLPGPRRYPRGASQVQCSVCNTVNCAMAVRARMLLRLHAISGKGIFDCHRKPSYTSVSVVAHWHAEVTGNVCASLPAGESGRPRRVQSLPDNADVCVGSPERQVCRLQPCDAGGHRSRAPVAAGASAEDAVRGRGEPPG